MTSEKRAQEFQTDDAYLPRDLDSAMSLKGQGNAPVNSSCAHAPPLRVLGGKFPGAGTLELANAPSLLNTAAVFINHTVE